MSEVSTADAPLYQLDAYCRRFPTRVTAADASAVQLDRSGFYPGGGGQPCDHGTLRGEAGAWAVTGARFVREGERPGVWYELDGEAPAVGGELEGELDWQRRYALMRTHTALHILCAVVWRDYGAKVTGANMEPLRGRMDFEFEHSQRRAGARDRGARERGGSRSAPDPRRLPAAHGRRPRPRPDPQQGQPAAAVDRGRARRRDRGARPAGRRRDARRRTRPRSGRSRSRRTRARAPRTSAWRSRCPRGSKHGGATPAGREAPGLSGVGASSARALARRARVRTIARGARRRPGLLLLRGPADGERQPWLPPRPAALLQGPLPALQDDARLLRAAQGRLGLPWAAGRAARSRSSSGSTRRRRSRPTGSAPSTTPAVSRTRSTSPRGRS